jgi:hypothetical protein
MNCMVHMQPALRAACHSAATHPIPLLAEQKPPPALCISRWPSVLDPLHSSSPPSTPSPPSPCNRALPWPIAASLSLLSLFIRCFFLYQSLVFRPFVPYFYLVVYFYLGLTTPHKHASDRVYCMPLVLIQSQGAHVYPSPTSLHTSPLPIVPSLHHRRSNSLHNQQHSRHQPSPPLRRTLDRFAAQRSNSSTILYPDLKAPSYLLPGFVSLLVLSPVSSAEMEHQRPRLADEPIDDHEWVVFACTSLGNG